jgi:hypothetical protein
MPPIVPTEDPNAPVVPVVETPEENKPDELTEKLDSFMEGVSEKLGELEQKMTPVTPDPPVDPEDDPDLTPPKDWKVARQEMDERARKTAREEYESIRAEEKRLADEEKALQEETNKQFDDQLVELEGKGLLPQIKDPSSDSDPGRIARAKLFSFAAKLQTPNLVEVASTLKAIEDSGQEYDYRTQEFTSKKPSVATPPFAPVGSSSARSGSPATGGMDYKTIHNARSLDDVIDAYNQKQ